MSQMRAEFPATDTEAFLTTGRGVFPHDRVESMRRGLRRKRCPRRGRCRRAPFCGRRGGGMWSQMWGGASGGSAYVVAVDVGGRSESSDLVGDSRDAASFGLASC